MILPIEAPPGTHAPEGAPPSTWTLDEVEVEVEVHDHDHVAESVLAQIARLFRAAAEAETIHALAHLANKGGVGTTIQNLKEAVAGETYEFTEMYPPMVEQAKAEGHKAKTMLDFANRAEKVHAGLFRQALEALEAGKDLSQLEVYLCPFCGDVELGVPPDRCPICGAPAAKFQKIG